VPTLDNGTDTLYNWAKTRDPAGNTAKVVEILNQKNPILRDMLYREGNLPTGMRGSIRTGLPAVAWRLYNQGIPATTSTETQIEWQTGHLQAFHKVDKELALLNGDQNAFRAMKAKAHLEALAQEFASTIFYGNGGLTPAEFTGLSPLYSSLSAASGTNILDGGGTGSDNLSIWLVPWGDPIHGIFPRGSTAGVSHQDLGEQVDHNAGGVAGANMRVLMDVFDWKGGLAVPDWRYPVRLSNIDVSDLIASNGEGASAAKLLNFMSRMLDRPPDFEGTTPIFYMNRTAFSMLRIQALNKSNAALAVVPALDQFGSPVGRGEMQFDGIPIHRCDALLNTESRVT